MGSKCPTSGIRHLCFSHSFTLPQTQHIDPVWQQCGSPVCLYHQTDGGLLFCTSASWLVYPLVCVGAITFWAGLQAVKSYPSLCCHVSCHCLHIVLLLRHFHRTTVTEWLFLMYITFFGNFSLRQALFFLYIIRYVPVCVCVIFFVRLSVLQRSLIHIHAHTSL